MLCLSVLADIYWAGCQRKTGTSCGSQAQKTSAEEGKVEGCQVRRYLQFCLALHVKLLCPCFNFF